MKKWGLTGNQLKIIALLTMTVDHIGHILYPRVAILRIIGRVSLPIFAYMIAEGCSHTRSMVKYFAGVAGVGAAGQLVAWLTTGTMRQNMLISFALAIGIIWLVRLAQKREQWWYWGLSLSGIGLVWLLDRYLLLGFPGVDSGLDYGFWGVMLPVLIYMGRTHTGRLAMTAVGLCLLALTGLPWQWWALEALPLLWLYNGQRGKVLWKWGFYIYYPAHLGVLYMVAGILA